MYGSTLMLLVMLLMKLRMEAVYIPQCHGEEGSAQIGGITIASISVSAAVATQPNNSA